MNKIITVVFLILSVHVFAQFKQFQGQGEIKPVETDSRPIQKQWKGNFPFENGAIVFSNNFSGARLNGIAQNNDSTFSVLITPENEPINPSPWYSLTVAI